MTEALSPGAQRIRDQLLASDVRDAADAASEISSLVTGLLNDLPMDVGTHLLTSMLIANALVEIGASWLHRDIYKGVGTLDDARLGMRSIILEVPPELTGELYDERDGSKR